MPIFVICPLFLSPSGLPCMKRKKKKKKTMFKLEARVHSLVFRNLEKTMPLYNWVVPISPLDIRGEKASG